MTGQFFLGVAVTIAICAIIAWIYLAKLSKQHNLHSQLFHDNLELNSENERLDKEREFLKDSIKYLESDIKVAEKARKDALDLASQQLELEREKQKTAFQLKLDEELEQMKQQHSLVNYQRLLEQLTSQIDEKKKTLRILQDQERELAEKEDFVRVHSLNLTDSEKSDIQQLREFAPRLSNRMILLKLIWSTYYQGKLQALRKELKADKTTGIYKISNVKSSKCYIGQAEDIGNRWAQHTKCALGIDVAAPNKFYSAMGKEGPENFTFEVLEECPSQNLNARERYWIDYYDSVAHGYNTLSGVK